MNPSAKQTSYTEESNVSATRHHVFILVESRFAIPRSLCVIVAVQQVQSCLPNRYVKRPPMYASIHHCITNFLYSLPQLAAIQAQSDAVILTQFTSDDAFTIGTSLRQRIRTLFPSTGAVINITSTNSDNLLFHCTTSPGVQPDNDLWVARKRATVKRWGVSSWYMHHKMTGSEQAFQKKYMLGERAGDYAIHGGGVPIRVKGVEGIVGVIVVSGLKQHEDHQVVIEALEQLLETQRTS